MTAKKILVVDDDSTHLVCAQEILEAAGYTVVTHQAAFGATDRVTSERPDLVLLDVNMPALSGEGLASVLAARPTTRDTPVILYSSNDEEHLRRTARRLNLAGYVCKGDPDALRRAVADVLR
jgi:CheY-like chemotaxis protein